MSGGSRETHTRALLGDSLFTKIRQSKLLVVGAGGIGCELLKNLVLVGFGNIELIDLDTIDLSNLNRQFLFRKADIKKSKALVASAFAHHFNPGPGPNSDSGKGVEIRPRHGNIKESENDVSWMRVFDMVLSALDNLEARRHLNRLCVAAGVPLIESGTQGYLGQVSPMMAGKTECFDCIAKPTPKTYPVCTIRATPSEPIHCIVWGKSYLLNKLFGEDDETEDEQELEKAKTNGENASVAEIEELKKEAAAFKEVRQGLASPGGAKRVFEKVFGDDIRRLLKMEDMWKVAGRVKPVALDYQSIQEGSFVVPPLAKKEAVQKASSSSKDQAENSQAATNGVKGLKDQQQLSAKDNLDLFIDSCDRLAARVVENPTLPISFDKDDDDTLDFTLATANLRAIAYGIPTKTRFEVKEMAGNIIPAIATTNAIIAGYIVMRAINILQQDWQQCKNVYLKGNPSHLIASYTLQEPEQSCGVCADVYIPLACDTSRMTLREFDHEVVRKWLGWNGEGEEIEFAIYEDKRLLLDPDFEDNHERTLADLGVIRGKMLSVADEDGLYRNVNFAICDLPSDAEAGKSFILPDQPPQIPRKPVVPQPTVEETPLSEETNTGSKRPASAMEDASENGPNAKKQKTENDRIDISDDEIEML